MLGTARLNINHCPGYKTRKGTRRTDLDDRKRGLIVDCLLGNVFFEDVVEEKDATTDRQGVVLRKVRCCSKLIAVLVKTQGSFKTLNIYLNWEGISLFSWNPRQFLTC